MAQQCVKDKKIVFVGDSLARNQLQSLQCAAIEGPGIPQPEITYSTLRASFQPPAAGSASLDFRLDVLLDARWFSHSKSEIADVDVVVLNTGSHWFPANMQVNQSEPDWKKTWMRVIDDTVRALVPALLDWVPQNARIIWRTPDISHVVAPDTEGVCVPRPPVIDPVTGFIEAGEQVQYLVHNSVMKHAMNTRIEIFNVAGLGAARWDGHPAARLNRTRDDGSIIYDCLHWCMPGVPDVWNQILLSYLCQNVTNG